MFEIAKNMDADRHAGGAMSQSSIVKWIGALLTCLALGACGGGGGSSGTSPFNPSAGTETTPAADLLVTLGSTSVTNTGTNVVTATVTAVSANRVALAGVPVAITANNNAVVVAAGAITDSNGRVTADIQIGTDRSNRIITVTATNASLQKSASFNVIGAKLDASALQAVLAPGASGQIDFRLTDVNSNPMAGLPITVSAVGLSGASGTTDSNGAYSFLYAAPTVTGTLNITAFAGGVTKTQSVIVQSGTGTIPAITAAIQSASVTANPSVVSVNTATSNNRSEIRALFLAANNAPIPNVRVVFKAVTSVGGTVSSGSNIVYSDANGVATTAYVPGTRSSPTDGVTVRACYYIDDATALADACASFADTQLTVVSEPLAVSIGTDNTIGSADGGLAYIKRYLVLVVDSSGQAKANVQITPSIDLTEYLKGFYVNPGAWTRDTGSGGYRSAPCANEDSNRNGTREIGEDINGNNQLDPRKSDVAISMENGVSVTDSSGAAVIQIKYAESVATWVNFRILVSAAGVSGTEGRATWDGQLPAAADDATGTNPPAFAVSPYGAGDPTRSAFDECRAPD